MGWRDEPALKNQARIFPVATEEWMLRLFRGALPIFSIPDTRDTATDCIDWWNLVPSAHRGSGANRAVSQIDAEPVSKLARISRARRDEGIEIR